MPTSMAVSVPRLLAWSPDLQSSLLIGLQERKPSRQGQPLLKTRARQDYNAFAEVLPLFVHVGLEHCGIEHDGGVFLQSSNVLSSRRFTQRTFSSRLLETSTSQVDQSAIYLPLVRSFQSSCMLRAQGGALHQLRYHEDPALSNGFEYNQDLTAQREYTSHIICSPSADINLRGCNHID